VAKKLAAAFWIEALDRSRARVRYPDRHIFLPSTVARSGGLAGRIPTKVGDVLILATEQSFTTYAVGHVTRDDQQDFHAQVSVKYASDRDDAVVTAKTLAAPGRRIFLRNLDTDHWSEISH
jgi:hypothetical protein